MQRDANAVPLAPLLVLVVMMLVLTVLVLVVMCWYTVVASREEQFLGAVPRMREGRRGTDHQLPMMVVQNCLACTCSQVCPA